MNPYIPGDIDHNGIVDILDLIWLSYAWYSKPGDPNWNAHADFNEDGIIDEKDLEIMSEHWYERFEDDPNPPIDFWLAWWLIRHGLTNLLLIFVS